MEVYRNKSLESANCRSVGKTDPETGDIAGTVRILKDIKKGEEFLRSYGIPTWIAMMPSRLNTNIIYRQWVADQYAIIFADSNPRIQFEAMCTMSLQLLR